MGRGLLAVLFFCQLSHSTWAQSPLQRARQLEDQGERLQARALIAEAARQNPNSIEIQAAWAAFLDRHNDPAVRAAYEKLLGVLPPSGGQAQRAAVARRLVLLDTLAGDRAAAARHIKEYRTAGGKSLGSAEELPEPPATERVQAFIEIPGPFSSFARMAALSTELHPEDLLPALARNLVTSGYQASRSNEALEPTEYLKLLIRYVSQARELERLAGSAQVIQIEACESPQTADLLRVIGYRMRGGCGGEIVLETVNATRAFLTINSGFPLAELEQALRTSRPFETDYKPTRVPVLFGEDYWLTGKERRGETFIDAFLADPALCRLYLGLAKLERATAEQLRGSVPFPRLKAFAHVLDFFGAMFELRDGRAVAPGGARSAAAWAELVGTHPDKGVEFYDRLIARDDGWLASYYDALARIHGPTLDYLTEPERMKRFYAALRGRVTSPGPARPVFRSNTDLMLLTTRLRIDANGAAHIPGSVEVWKNLFVRHPHGRYDGRLTRLAASWKEPDDVVEALFGLCRRAVENEPLKMFMALSDMNRGRATPLQPPTVERLINGYREFSAQFSVLNEVTTLSDTTIAGFLDTARRISQVRNQMLRADTAGSFQALVGLWQILCRNRSIPAAEADSVLTAILGNFETIEEDELFDRTRASIDVLRKATRSPEGISVQDRFIDLVAGVTGPGESEPRQLLIQETMQLFEAQRLVSMKTLFDLADHLDELARGGRLNTALLGRLAGRISEIESPRAPLSTIEKNAMAFGYWTERHIDRQRRANIRAEIERATGNPERIRRIRNSLVPFLRDTLVGLNYLHYAPSGAQILRTNPLFVRSHDFLGMQGATQTWRLTEVHGTGWPSSAGGRLVGSLAGLPYALADAEQNFLVPDQEQALIWGDLAPQMILTAKVAKWWDVPPNLLHWVGLHFRYAEAAFAQAAWDENGRATVLNAMAHMAVPARIRKLEQLLASGQASEALARVTPAELFDLSRRLLGQDSAASGDPFGPEIQRLASASPAEINYGNVSRLLGTPKPTLTHSYRLELLNLRTFPTLMGFSSRIMAESWESNLLYFAALADELHLDPAQLNVLVPQWTQQTVEAIFATHLEDWPALLRSLRAVGEDVRAKTRKQWPSLQQASLLQP